MKKKFIALALGITTALSATPLMPAKALEPPITGDFNQDWTVNIADIICCQKYLLGSGKLNMNYSFYYDLNKDGNIDVFDYILLKQKVITKDSKVESRFTQVDVSIPLGVTYARPSASDCIIRSVEDLELYLSPYNVVTRGDGDGIGECIFVEAACQEVLDDLYARYDEEFFRNNVLLLNYLPGTDGYEFESIQYEGDKLVIKYYDSTPYGLHWTAPLPPYIAEVAVPKDLWTDGDYKWERVEQPVEMTMKTDFTNEITDSAIISSYSKPSVIETSEELDEYLDGKFHAGVEMSLKDTYNDEFFADNVLIIDLYYQRYREDWITSLSIEKDEYNDLGFYYDRKFINGFADTGMQINQVVIPKEQYHFSGVFKRNTWEIPADISYTSHDLYSIAEIGGFENSDCYSKDGEWINSAEEMRTYLADVMSYEMAEYLFPELYSTDDTAIDTALYKPWLTNWNNQSVYMWVDSDVIGSSSSLINAAYDNDRITLTVSKKQPHSCMGGNFLHIIKTDKRHSGKKVIEDNINMSNFMPHTDGESAILQFGKDVVMLNQYTFGNKNVADIYRLRLGGGPVQYSGYDYIGTVEFAEDYFPVKGDSSHISYAEGEKIVMESGEYKITIENEQLTITYKYSADSEYTEQTFAYAY